MVDPHKLAKLRLVITENLRIQRGGAEPVPYIDVSNALTDITARQNHAVFGRRGCGKTLLLQHSATKLPPGIRTIYLNCEDFKNHSFPNVLIEILDAVFAELSRNLTGWFGRKRRSKEIILEIRHQLEIMRMKADEHDENVREAQTFEAASELGVKFGFEDTANFNGKTSETEKAELELTYKRSDNKISDLNMWLPRLKQKIRDFFELSTSVKAVFIQVDDLYHLKRADQPFVMDYIHRLCKDLPLYFKVATLRHASALYADRKGQPTGAQERHDYQPINIDFTFSDFRKTEAQNLKILQEFGRLAGLNPMELNELFKGHGYRRLILAGGGVPRDCLSLFLEVLDQCQHTGDGRIGKDDVRILSRSNFERRIEELKQDSEGVEQDALIKGIYVLRKFCINRETNVFFVSEQMLQMEDRIRNLIYRLLDYRIIHSAGSALTHKSQSGTFHAFMIDIGCYAHMRTLEGRFHELDIADAESRERMRSAPILDIAAFTTLWKHAPANPESELLVEDYS